MSFESGEKSERVSVETQPSYRLYDFVRTFNRDIQEDPKQYLKKFFDSVETVLTNEKFLRDEVKQGKTLPQPIEVIDKSVPKEMLEVFKRQLEQFKTDTASADQVEIAGYTASYPAEYYRDGSELYGTVRPWSNIRLFSRLRQQVEEKEFDLLRETRDKIIQGLRAEAKQEAVEKWGEDSSYLQEAIGNALQEKRGKMYNGSYFSTEKARQIALEDLERKQLLLEMIGK